MKKIIFQHIKLSTNGKHWLYREGKKFIAWDKKYMGYNEIKN